MPLFAVICRDNPGATQLRKDTREAHLAHLRARDIVRLAGPLIEDGDMAGSLIVIEAPSLDEARAWAEADPYRAAGLFRSAEVLEWKKVIG